MPLLDGAELNEGERALVEAALAADPALAADLELIGEVLAGGARQRFWRAFARGCGMRERPAAAVLAALETAARGE